MCGCGREYGAGMSALVGGMLDALPHMRRASLPATEVICHILLLNNVTK